MYSVQVGTFRSSDNADALAEALRRAGFEAVVTTED
jgi:cell division septation protein DedD